MEALAATSPELDLTVFSSSWKDRLGSLPVGVTPVDRRFPVRLLNYCWHRLGWPPVELVAGQFDVVHSPHPLLIPSSRAARVVTIHDLDFLDHPDHTEAEVYRDYSALVREHARHAEHVIVPSRYTGSEVERRLGIASDRITVCHNGAPDWSPRDGWPSRGHLLFVGSLAPRKNIVCLLEAYRLLLERRTGHDLPPLILAGPPTSHAAEWLSAIESPPLAGRVQCTGYLDRSALRTLYEEAAVLVLPSLHEGFGLPVVEAMTVGVPVVVSDRGALPEVVGGAGLTIDPTRPAQLADAVERMLTDELFARACVERGFQQAAGFTWGRSAQALRDAYQQAYNQRA